jgi:hypothetical protein
MSNIRGLRWWLIALIMLGSIINYLTRSTFAVIAPTLLKDLNHCDHDVVGSVQEERGGNRRRNGGHTWQRRLAHFLSTHPALVIKIGYRQFCICRGLLDIIGTVILWTG